MASVISLGVDDLPIALELGEQRMRQGIAYGMLAGAHRGRALIVKRTPVDMSQLKGSWRVIEGDREFAGLHSVMATLRNDAPHISMVELGARPHAVNPEGWSAIYEWVRRHYRGGQLGGAGRMRRQRRGAQPERPFHGPDPVIEQITNAIVWKIRKYGMKPTFFVRNAVDDLRELMAYELARAMRQAESEIASRGGRPGGGP